MVRGLQMTVIWLIKQFIFPSHNFTESKICSQGWELWVLQFNITEYKVNCTSDRDVFIYIYCKQLILHIHLYIHTIYM